MRLQQQAQSGNHCIGSYLFSYVPLHKSPGKALFRKGYELVGFMEEAGGYFFGHGARRGEPRLDSPPDRQCLDRAKDRIGMHAAELVTPQDFRDRAFDNHSRKIKFAQAFTRPHKGLSGAITLSSNPAIE